MQKVFLHTAVMMAGLILFAAGQTEITTQGSGKWSSTTPNAPWPNGALPSPSDKVIIADADTVTIDTSASIAGLTVGTGTGGAFQFSKTDTVNMTINGNLIINAGGIFKVLSNTLSPGGNLLQTLTISGSITHAGAGFDCRVGSNGSTLSALNITFVGGENSTVTMNNTYSTTNGEFNGWTINKTGSANVILGSNVYISSGNSTNVPSNLIFKHGNIVTGNFSLNHLSTTSATISGYSDSTGYVIGALGRGMSTTAGASKVFPVGDEHGLRPITVRSTTSGIASGHYVNVRVVPGNASNSSTFDGVIDKVSGVRYYTVTYDHALPAADSMSFDKFSPSYGEEDGVAAGNTDLRVAYSTNDNRALWTGMGQTIPHTTTVTPHQTTTITPDSLHSVVTLKAGTGQIFIALARLKNTVTNSLDSPPTIVEMNNAPSQFMLYQNYPNPFNPETEISFNTARRGYVTLRVYDLLGRKIMTLIDGILERGNSTVQWNGKNEAGSAVSSGIYIYRLESEGIAHTKKMVLIK